MVQPTSIQALMMGLGCARLYAVQIIVILLLLSRLVGWHASVGGFLASILLVPASAALMRRIATVRRRLVALSDTRVKLCSEIVSGGYDCSTRLAARPPVQCHPT